MKILVVDDDKAVRDSLQRALVLEGYEVELAPDGTTAVKSLTQAAPDAVILDLQLPDIDGLEVCRRLRTLGDRTPVLMLTARDALNDRVEGLDAGADDYLVKPFELAELFARLRALLRRRAPLEMFLLHPRQVLTRELILDQVWGYDFDSGTNSLAVYVGYLRRKTEEGGEARLIQTVRGVGYVLKES